jgi:signal transduction histidine kinase
MSTTSETIGQFEFFTDLHQDALAKIARLTREKHFPAGTKIFQEDDAADYLYLLLEGRVSLEKRVQLGRTGTPRQATISVVGAGETIGWSSLVPPYNYTSSGVCLDACRTLAIPGNDLRTFLEQHPEVGTRIYHRVASIVRTRMVNATSTMTYFLSIVSHELKRPLAAVENYIQILIGGYAGELSAKQQHLLERSKLRLTDLRNLISDILDFARIQSDQIQADFEWVEPSEIGAEAIEEVRLAADQKDIRLKAVGSMQVQPLIAARRRLRQVISNLLANAIKFSPEGSTVTLGAHDNPESLIIEILDEGIGIPQEDQNFIFDDFFRASNASEYGGAGLGLSIAKKIIDAHDGRIEVQSPYQPEMSGTKFTVTLPRTLNLPLDRPSADSQVEEQHPDSEST